MAKGSARLLQTARLLVALVTLFVTIGAVHPRSVSAANGSVIYTYDALGRVTTASYDTGVFVYYTYDANGNRLSEVINVNTATLTWTLTVSPCTANCWGAGLW